MEIRPGKTNVGFIGLGVMGKSMASHILQAGYDLHVYTRTKTGAEELIKKGAVWHDSVAELSPLCDVIITIVGFPKDVEEVYLEEGGILYTAKPGAVVVDMTTSSPALAEKIFQKAKERGIASLDAPVSGGDLGARNRALSIMVGGERNTFEAMSPLFATMGKNIVYQGKAGAGQHTKMANQIAIASGMIAICESLSYAQRAGLDLETVLASIGQGAAGSWALNNLGPRIIDGDMEPGFFVKHFIKDMNIASDMAKKLELETPGLDLTLSLYKKLAEKGLENKGTQALATLFDSF